MIELVANDHNNVSLNMIIVDMNEDETESEKYSMKLIFSPFNLINVFTHLLDRTPSSLKITERSSIYWHTHIYLNISQN